MPVPANRVPVRVARGTYAILSAEIASLQEGEVCYATDEDRLYVVEGGALVATGADLSTSSIDALSDVDTSTVAPTDGQVLTWDNAAGKWEPADAGGAVDSVNGQTGVVVLDVENLGNVKPPGASASLMLNMEGANNGTTFTDTSPSGLTVTANNGAVTSSTQFKYGSTSLYLPNTNSGLSMSAADAGTAFGFGAGDFTVEAWVYCTTASSGNAVYGWGISASINPSSFLTVNSSSGALLFAYSTDGVNPVYVNSSTVGSLVNGWHHVAVCRSGGSLYGYIDGAQVINTTITGSIANQPGWSAYIGTHNNGTNTLAGYIDDFRTVNGTAIYTAPFTPPTEALSGSGGSASDGQVLTWVTANGQWEPVSLGGATVRAALGIGEYADDTAAGTGGVASGAMYYNTTSSDYRLKS